MKIEDICLAKDRLRRTYRKAKFNASMTHDKYISEEYNKLYKKTKSTYDTFIKLEDTNEDIINRYIKLSSYYYLKLKKLIQLERGGD